MKVITLSKKFLQTHPKAGKSTYFEQQFLNGCKIHTIRANAKGYFKDGDIVSIRQWSGKPYNSKQEIIKDNVKICVVPIFVELFKFYATVNNTIDVDLEIIAKNDGLSSIDFHNWFKQKKDKFWFSGSLIYFTDFRYK